MARLDSHLVELALPATALLTFGLLTAALAALWLPVRRLATARRHMLWALPAVLAALAGLAFGYVDWLGVVVLLALAGACWTLNRDAGALPPRVAAGVVVTVLAGGLFLHVIPGFANLKVIDAEVLKGDAIPYSKFLNFDKAAVGLLLIAFGTRRLAGLDEWQRMLRGALPVTFASLGAVLLLSIALGFVRFDPAPVSLGVGFVWAWTNLFFTCIAEEAVFRGLIQKALEWGLGQFRWGSTLSLVIASLIFGLAHFAGGWSYVLLSAVAGLGYGYAMQRTGRIEAAILTHFGVNLVHIALFTYPALARAV